MAVTSLHVVITGAAQGKIERTLSVGDPTARVVPIVFTLSGRDNLTVTVTARSKACWFPAEERFLFHPDYAARKHNVA